MSVLFLSVDGMAGTDSESEIRVEFELESRLGSGLGCLGSGLGLRLT